MYMSNSCRERYVGHICNITLLYAQPTLFTLVQNKTKRKIVNVVCNYSGTCEDPSGSKSGLVRRGEQKSFYVIRGFVMLEVVMAK